MLRIEPKSRVDLEAVLPISLIRTHCKIDDVLSVTDDQLVLYREHAAKEAEDFTGRLWFQYARVTQDYPMKAYSTFRQVPRIHKVSLTYEPANDFVEFSKGSVMRLQANYTRSTEVIIPSDFVNIDINDCCNPCAQSAYSQQYPMVTYDAGNHDAKAIPAGIKVGMLKVIAWLTANPGDVYNPVISPSGKMAGTGSGGTIGTNNAAFASGASDEWRHYRRL